MSEQPITAAELAKRVGIGLSRYTKARPERTAVIGKLDNVTNLGNRSLFVTVRHVADLGKTEFCSATITATSRAIEEVLERIGKGGNVELIGTAVSRKDALAAVEMSTVESVNGRSLAEIETAHETESSGPLAAAELARRAHAGLQRYARSPATPARIDGRLRDVHDAATGLFIVIDNVEGLEKNDFCLAELRHPTDEEETRLQTIAKGNRILVTGVATSEAGGLAKVVMHEVHTITGTTESDDCDEKEPQEEKAPSAPN